MAPHTITIDCRRQGSLADLHDQVRPRPVVQPHADLRERRRQRRRHDEERRRRRQRSLRPRRRQTYTLAPGVSQGRHHRRSHRRRHTSFRSRVNGVDEGHHDHGRLRSPRPAGSRDRHDLRQRRRSGHRHPEEHRRPVAASRSRCRARTTSCRPTASVPVVIGGLIDGPQTLAITQGASDFSEAVDIQLRQGADSRLAIPTCVECDGGISNGQVVVTLNNNGDDVAVTFTVNGTDYTVAAEAVHDGHDQRPGGRSQHHRRLRRSTPGSASTPSRSPAIIPASPSSRSPRPASTTMVSSRSR